MLQIFLRKSSNPAKKYMVTIVDKSSSKTIHFGAKNYSDYTKHKDPERKARYDARHKSRENWKKSGIKTAGFWSKWLLWNKPSIAASKADISRRFSVRISSGVPPKTKSR